jgi:hypothetical protein
LSSLYIQQIANDWLLEGVHMTNVRTALSGPPPASRSRVGNGSRALEGVNGGTRRGRRYRDLLDGFIAEFSAVNESDLARCRSAAMLALASEDLAAEIVNGTPNREALAARVSTRLQRVLNDLRASARQHRRGR